MIQHFFLKFWDSRVWINCPEKTEIFHVKCLSRVWTLNLYILHLQEGQIAQINVMSSETFRYIQSTYCFWKFGPRKRSLTEIRKSFPCLHKLFSLVYINTFTIGNEDLQFLIWISLGHFSRALYLLHPLSNKKP